MIKKVVLTVITGVFLFSGLAYADIKEVKADKVDVEKSVQTAEKTETPNVTPDLDAAKVTDEKIDTDKTTHVEKKCVAEKGTTKS